MHELMNNQPVSTKLQLFFSITMFDKNEGWLTEIICIYIPGSGPRAAPEEHMDWFGHPWHADTFPADSLWVPGQSVNFKYVTTINYW